MKTTGTVKNVTGKYAQVECVRESACDGCHSKDFCLACSKKMLTVKAKNQVGALPGDEVEIESPSGTVLGYAALIFVVPIIVALAGYFLGGLLFSGDAGAYLTSLCLFVACFIVLYFVFNSKSMKDKNPHIIVKIIKKDIDKSEEMGDKSDS